MFIFFIQLTSQGRTGRCYLHRQKSLLFFPGSIQASSIVKILSSFCNRYRYNYIPNRDLWIDRLYFDISNSSKKQCLTVDTRDVNDLGPAKFRTQADTSKEQSDCNETRTHNHLVPKRTVNHLAKLAK